MFLPKKFITKNAQEIVLRQPATTDVDELTRYANELSQEDTYVVLSGEVLTRVEESEHLTRWIDEMKKGNRMQVFAFFQNRLMANAQIRRVTKSRKRQLHVGEIAISVAKDWRGHGIGKEILTTLIAEGKKMGLRLVQLSTFATNTRAITLYKTLGFQIAGEIPGAIWYKDEYISHVYMYLPLE